MRIYLVILFSLFFSSSCLAEIVINFLPDGTEIKIQDNIVYAVCDGKFMIVPDGYYMMADGSSIIVKNGILKQPKKTKKWEVYPEQDPPPATAKDPLTN